jgi:thioredoxin-related protein
MLISAKSKVIDVLHLLLCVIAVVFSGAVVAEEEKIDLDTDNAVSAPLGVAMANDLAAVGTLSKEKGVPILLMFSTADCNYCKRLEAEVLGPMRIAGIDPKRVILRKVVLDEYDTLRDFSGHERNAESFGNSRGVDVVPTLELLDATGKVLVPKIVGYQTPGLYADYLEKAIEVSRSLLVQR